MLMAAAPTEDEASAAALDAAEHTRCTLETGKYKLGMAPTGAVRYVGQLNPDPPLWGLVPFQVERAQRGRPHVEVLVQRHQGLHRRSRH